MPHQVTRAARYAFATIAAIIFATAIWTGHTASAQQLNWTGRITTMPVGGSAGQWVVGGRTFTATAATDIREDKGPLATGVCAEVEYVGTAEPFSATKIASKNSDDCGTATPTPTTTPGATPSTTPSPTPGGGCGVGCQPAPTGTPSATPSGEAERYGRIDSFPANLIGEWVVNGVTYTATAGSEFKQEDGPFAVGACVKVHALTTTTPATVREIETERAYRCGGQSGAGAEAEAYGVLQSFPANLIGEWNVGGMVYVADAATEFKQEGGPFATGTTVKVHFSTDAAGVNRAREIETKFANDDGGSDDDGNGAYEGAEGHAYGIAESVPNGLVGAWSIGGVGYTATASTKFEQSDGPLANGARVKVEYFLGAGGARIAKKIESTSDNGGAAVPSNTKVFGFVSQMPAGGLVGTWVIDNVAYEAGVGTKFDESDAVLGVGAYVAVEYSVVNGQKVVHEIEAHVPPGAGPQTQFGTIDDKGGATLAASVQANNWVIGGVRYGVVPATSFNDFFGTLDVGSTAVVNSYTAADGSLVATQIRSVSLVTNLFIPAVRR